MLSFNDLPRNAVRVATACAVALATGCSPAPDPEYSPPPDELRLRATLINFDELPLGTEVGMYTTGDAEFLEGRVVVPREGWEFVAWASLPRVVVEPSRPDNKVVQLSQHPLHSDNTVIVSALVCRVRRQSARRVQIRMRNATPGVPAVGLVAYGRYGQELARNEGPADVPRVLSVETPRNQITSFVIYGWGPTILVDDVLINY